MASYTALAVRISCFLPTIVFALAISLSAAELPRPCRVEIVEQGTNWPVPLVELRTVHQVRFVSDNAGLIAFDLPELMGRATWFDVVGHGYERPADGFGYRGVRLTPQPGATLRVEVVRKSVARRIGRLTGAGLFAESQKLGLEPDWRDGPVLGCDSVLCAEYRDKLYWAWGDTNLAHYPLGVFHTTSATTDLRPWQPFEPPLRPKFDYFVDEHGKPRGVAPMPGDGPTWLTGYVVLEDSSGRPTLAATYQKIKPPLDVYEVGQCTWNDATKAFERRRVAWTKSAERAKQPIVPEGHPASASDAAGMQWVYFGNPLPTLRCPATVEAWLDPATWEELVPQSQLVSAADGKPVTPHGGSIAWSDCRKRWVTVFVEKFGKPSALGELWYAEADEPSGPWGPAVKVLSHENYTFYNPRLHAEWSPAGSPILLFEGTYTHTFANRPPPTPRYDYNQILYRLDLDDPALRAAQARD